MEVAPTAIAVTISEERSVIDPPWGIEPPAERAIPDAIAREERVSIEPRVPVPTVPTPPTPTVSGVHAGGVDVGFRQIGGAQAAPTIQVAFFISVLVELAGLQRGVGDQVQLTSALDGDRFAAIFNGSCAVKHAQLIFSQVEIVQTRLQQSGCGTVFGDAKIIFRMNLRHFDHGVSLVDLELCVGETWRNHSYRTVVSNAQENAGRQQNLSLALSSS